MSRRSNYNEMDSYSRDGNFGFSRNSNNNNQQFFDGPSGSNQGSSRDFNVVNPKPGIANDRSTMDERKEFFRQLGLPRFEVYDYAVRSFETPSFDLDYFEYRRFNLQRQNVSENIIKNQLLNEVRNSLQEPTRGSGGGSFQSSQYNRKIATPPPPNLSDFLPTMNVEKNKPFKNNQPIGNNQRFQQTDSRSGYGNNNHDSSNQNWLKGNNNMNNSSTNQRFGNNNDQFGNQMSAQRMSTNQDFQDTDNFRNQSGSGFGQNNNQFGNNGNTRGFQQTASSFEHNNDQFNNNMNIQRFQQAGSGSGRNNDNFGNNMNSQRMQTNRDFEQSGSGSGFGNNNQFGNNMNSSRMSNNQGSSFGNNNDIVGNNQNSQRASNNWQETSNQSVWQTNATQQFGSGTSNWNQNNMQSNSAGWGQNTPQNWIQGSKQMNRGQSNSQNPPMLAAQSSRDRNFSSRGQESSRDRNAPARGGPTGNNRNPPARGAPSGNNRNAPARVAPSGNNRNPPARGAPSGNNRNASARGAPSGNNRNPPARVAPSGNNRNAPARVTPSGNNRNAPARNAPSSSDQNARPALQPKPKQQPPISKRPSRSRQRRQPNNSSIPPLMSNFQTNDFPNNFNNNLGNCNDPNSFPNAGFNNFPINEPSLEDQVSGIVVQALQHISNTINQPMNQPGGLRIRMKAQIPRKAGGLPFEENPFLRQRTKSFEKQFKKFDCCILLSRRPQTDREDLSKGLSFLKTIKKRPLPAGKDDAAPAAKRRKQDNENENEKESTTKDGKEEDKKEDAKEDKKEDAKEEDKKEDVKEEEENKEPKNEENIQVEETKTETADDSKPEAEIEEEEEKDGEHKFTMKRKKRDTKSLSQRKVETFTKSIIPKGRIEEFIPPEVYGDDVTKMPKRYSFKDYGIWFKKYRWVKDHVMKVEDTDPAIRKIFFCSARVQRKVNNERIIECEKIIAKAVKIQDEGLMHTEAYEFLKARTQYTEFLYVFKKSFLSHEGLRCLQQIYDHLLTANTVGFYKGIIEKFAMVYGKNGCEAKKPKNKELLADKAFNWLVENALKELKRMFNRTKLNERLNELYHLGCFIDKRAIENAKILYQNHDYADMDVKELTALIKKQSEINWKNCRQFMRLELLVTNDLFNQFLEGEILEQRKELLEKLKTDPYVEKVHMYMARKLLNIFERIKYLESIHPRMIAREELKQLISFRKFLAMENLKLMVKHILQQWKKQYGNFTKQKYKELFPHFPIIKNETDNNENNDDDNEEDPEELNDNENGGGDVDVDADGDEKMKTLNEEDIKETLNDDQNNEDDNEAKINEENKDEDEIIENIDEVINEIKEDNPDTVDLVSDDEGKNGGVDESEKIEEKQNEVVDAKLPQRARRGRGFARVTTRK